MVELRAEALPEFQAELPLCSFRLPAAHEPAVATEQTGDTTVTASSDNVPPDPAVDQCLVGGAHEAAEPTASDSMLPDERERDHEGADDPHGVGDDRVLVGCHGVLDDLRQ